MSGLISIIYFNNRIITGSRFYGDRLKYRFLLNVGRYHNIIRIVIKIIKFYNSI